MNNHVIDVIHLHVVPTYWAYSICLSDVRGAKFPTLFDAERSRDLSASKSIARTVSPVSPLAWHVVRGETESRGTNMAEYKEG